MNTLNLRRPGILLVLLCATLAVDAAEHPNPGAAAPITAAASAAVQSDEKAADKREADEKEDAQDDFVESAPAEHYGRQHKHHRSGDSGNDLVSIGHDSHLAAGEKADSVVSVLGSSTSEGEAGDVVSVLGNTRVTGPTHGDAVAVFGNLYIDSKVDGDAVAVFGSIELGPHAEVDGDVNSVLGAVHRAPEAATHGSLHDVSVGDVDMGWLQTWVHACLLEGRPLALVSGIGWAWTLAFLCLAFYTFLALVFRGGVTQCVTTLETHPGQAALTALLAGLLTPVLLVLLCVTVIGIAGVPIVLLALFCVTLFGKAVVLAWLGHRVSRNSAGETHPAVAVLIGGAIALALYVIPVVGLLVYKLLGFFGFGAVLYTLLLGQRARQAAKAEQLNGTYVADAAQAAQPGPSPAGPAQVLAALPRAGFWLRMAALLIDVILVGIVSSFVLDSFHHHSNLHLLVLATYGACMWKLRGSTVGGIVFDLRVVRVDGRQVEWETAIVRALSCFLSAAVCGLGFIWIAFDANHQAWHDKIAGTLVVRVPKGQPLVSQPLV